MITGYLIGDKALIAKFDAMPSRVKRDLDKIVQELGIQLQRKVQSDYLRGPRPTHLGVVTGRLLGSITQGASQSRSRFETSPTSAFAFVGTNVVYGAPWEYGFTKRIGAGARGGPRTLTGKARDTYFAKHPPGVKQTGPRPFLAPALSDMRQIIVDKISAGLQRSAVEALK